MKSSKIKSIKALQILDSRGSPTIEAKVFLEDGSVGWSAVPSGASTGSHEAWELRDGDQDKYGGKGVLKAVSNVNQKIFPVLMGRDAGRQQEIDQLLIDLDATENKGNLGANAILSVSLAVSRAAAVSKGVELYNYLRQLFWEDKGDFWLPVPMFNVLNGGKHAIGSVDLQEFMIVPVGASEFKEALRWGAEIYQALKKMLHARGLPVGVGDEGGFMPKFWSHEELLKTLEEAVAKAGYSLGSQVALALDPAASEVYADGKYHLKTEGKVLTSSEMVFWYQEWINKFPIVSIEDGLAEDDWEGFSEQTRVMGDRIQIVGDDLYATNIKRLEKGIKEKTTNSILIKLNQIGTLTETVKAIDLALANKMTAVVSNRSGETEDSYIADLVVAAGTGQIKTGAPCRSERVAKYNRLLIIEDELGKKAKFAKFPFPRK